MSSVFGQTSYITERSPNFYGGKQEEYLALAEQAICSGVSLISEEMGKKSDPAKIYETVVKFFQNTRHDIACKHQPEMARLFGVRRDQPKVGGEPYVVPTTGLYFPYQEYNKKYLNQLIPVLHKIPHDLKTFKEHSTQGRETVLGRQYSYHVELLDIAELQKRQFTKPPTRKICRKR
jgi:hypothetical protein